MRKKWILLLVVACIVFDFGSQVYAHEMYYTKNGSTINAIQLRWNHKNSMTGRLKVHIDPVYLSGSWKTNYETARTAWHSSAVPAEYITSTTTTNTRMATTTEQFWTNKFGAASITYEVMGYCELYDTNSLLINSFASADSSTKKINATAIYLNPKPIYNNKTFDYVSTMTHEFGHILGLGHSHLSDYSPASPSTDPSIMSYNYLELEKSYAPQNHELTDVKNYYGY